MSSSQSNTETPSKLDGSSRSWLEFGATPIAWHCMGLLFAFVLWRSCVHQEPLGGPSPHPVARMLFFLFWIATFSVAFTAGVMSYRTWRKLSEATGLLSAEARERKEYMPLCGLFMTAVLGVGLLWECLPLFMLQMCLRTR